MHAIRHWTCHQKLAPWATYASFSVSAWQRLAAQYQCHCTTLQRLRVKSWNTGDQSRSAIDKLPSPQFWRIILATTNCNVMTTWRQLQYDWRHWRTRTSLSTYRWRVATECNWLDKYNLRTKQTTRYKPHIHQNYVFKHPKIFPPIGHL
jgi:hypothetical protein